MVQYLIVGLIVVAAAVYAAWLLAPAGARRAGAGVLAAMARRLGLGSQASARLETKLAQHGGCGDCKACKQCPTARRATPPGSGA